MAPHDDDLEELGRRAFECIQKKQIQAALEIFDVILAFPDLALEHYANALWVVQRDNTGLPVDAERSRRYLKACLPHAPKNPTLYINAAGVCMELAQPDDVIKNLLLAAQHGVDVRP